MIILGQTDFLELCYLRIYLITGSQPYLSFMALS